MTGGVPDGIIACWSQSKITRKRGDQQLVSTTVLTNKPPEGPQDQEKKLGAPRRSRLSSTDRGGRELPPPSPLPSRSASLSPHFSFPLWGPARGGRNARVCLVICASCRTQGNYFIGIGHSERQLRFIFATLLLPVSSSFQMHVLSFCSSKFLSKWLVITRTRVGGL
jgi:hypothetical protein